MATKTLPQSVSPPPVPSAQQISLRDNQRAMRLHHARTGIEFAVQASAGKEWTPEHVHELATAFMEMMESAYDPSA